MLLKNPNKRTKPVMGKIMKAVRDLPHIARHLITFDRGSEFASGPHLQAEFETQTWFREKMIEEMGRSPDSQKK